MFCSFATVRRFLHLLCSWLIAVAYTLMVSCTASSRAQAPDFSHWQKNKACVKWVDSVYASLSTEQQIGQFFMVAAYTQGKDYNMDSVWQLIKEGSAGGVIFFKGNPTAQVEWTNRLQDSARVKVFVAIDGEWGLAMRIDSTTQFPRQMTLGAVTDNRLIYQMGREIGRQCRRMGIHINFAPVVDVNNNAANPVINERSFGEDKYKVALKGLEYAQGLQDEGVLASAKHFPGHGDVTVDSHYDLPVINKTAAGFDSLEFYPFRILFNNGVGSVMVAHLQVPALDADTLAPASLSKKIATGWLKDSLGYNGLVFSDALNMKGVSKFYKPGTVDSIAFMAGCDILVFSENPREGIRKIKLALDSNVITADYLQQRVKKVLAYKYMTGVHRYTTISTNNLTDDLNLPEAKVLRQKLFEQAITIAANQDNLLPLRSWPYRRVASLSIGNNGISQFQQHCFLFEEMDLFNQPLEHNETAFRNLFDTLAGYDLVIIDLHAMVRSAARDYNVTEETRKFVEQLSGRTRVVLLTFGNAYALKFFSYLPWLVCAYEDNEATQLAAANALFGAERVAGRLPVTAARELPAGTGFISDTVYRLKISWPEELNYKSEELARVDGIIKTAMEKKSFPGCQLLVAKNGKVIWNKAYGQKIYELKEPPAVTDLYDLASITKVAATTLAVMKLYSEKKLSVEKTVGDYLTLPATATIGKLKLKDILTHQAGLKPFFMFWKETVGNNAPLYYRKTPEPGFTTRVADSLFIRNDYADTMWHLMACSAVNPSPRYEYSDLDFYILQKVVEAISGMGLDTFVQINFYSPMGLTRIGYRPLERVNISRIPPTENDTLFRKQIVRGYVHDPGAAMYGGVAGHAGLFSNAFDLAAIFQLLLNYGTYNGRQLLDSATIRYFTQRHSKISRRGLGFDKPEPDATKPSPCYDGVPLSVYGHTGFTGTCVWADPDNQLIYIFLSNRVYPNADNNMLVKMNVRTDLQEAIYRALKL